MRNEVARICAAEANSSALSIPAVFPVPAWAARRTSACTWVASAPSVSHNARSLTRRSPVRRS